MTVGIAGVTKVSDGQGNTRLVDYGIQTEKSDLRVHVCVVVRRLYVYETQNGLDAISRGGFQKKPVYTNSIKTAEGYCVPPRSIPGCRQIEVGQDVWEQSGIIRYPPKGYHKEKGDAAVYIAKAAIKAHLIPLKLNIEDIDDEDMQIDGTDIFVSVGTRIQVKCDYEGGPRAFGGTGNLFLQVAECNPFGIH